MGFLREKVSDKAIQAYKKKYNLDFWPDLRGVSFRGLDTPEINLSEANLQGAKFVSTNLQSSNLQGANLMDANFQNADLRNTDMRWAYLQRANLENANLEKADLRRADLEEASISGAKMKTVKGLTKKQVLQTTWADKGIESKVPELPDKLMKDPDIQKWLKTLPSSSEDRKNIIEVPIDPFKVKRGDWKVMRKDLQFEGNPDRVVYQMFKEPTDMMGNHELVFEEEQNFVTAGKGVKPPNDLQDKKKPSLHGLAKR